MTINAHMHKSNQQFKGSEFSCARVSFNREIIDSAEKECWEGF